MDSIFYYGAFFFEFTSRNFLVTLSIVLNLPTYSLFHSVGYKNHTVGYIFHSVKYKSHTVKQSFCKVVLKK